MDFSPAKLQKHKIMNIKIPENGFVLNQMIKVKNFLIGAELGVRRGELSSSLLSNNNLLKMICVDLWGHHESFNESHPHDINFNSYLKNIDGLESRVNTIKKLTTDAAKEIEDGSLDFIFLDATHTYNALRADILTWLPKVKKGGLIAGHDYHPAFDNSGIIRVVNEIFGKPEKELPSGEFSFDTNTNAVVEYLIFNNGLVVDHKTTCWYKINK